jgi:acyl-CoA synthetase (AMP-forming)/AMP-acid ligase II
MQSQPMVLGDVIERNARLYPNKEAIVFEGRRATYAQFAAQARRCANMLHAGGLKPQARVAMLAQNCLEYLEIEAAAELAGFIVVTLNWRLSPHELAQIVKDCTPAVLIFESCFAGAADHLRRLDLGIERFIVIGEEVADKAVALGFATEASHQPAQALASFAYDAYSHASDSLMKGSKMKINTRKRNPTE